jgi:acyl carrier protein
MPLPSPIVEAKTIDEDQIDWTTFLCAVKPALPPAVLGPDTRLVDDLALDSLALTEFLVFLIVDLGWEQIEGDLEARDWTGATLADVHAVVRGAHR